MNRGWWVSAAFAVGAYVADSHSQARAVEADALEALSKNGEVRLIVEVFEGELGQRSAQSLIGAIANDAKLDVAAINRLVAVARIRDRSTLSRLVNSTAVRSISLDRAVAAKQAAVMPGVSTALRMTTRKMDGLGTTVAIIDTAVDDAHPQLEGKIELQGCFSVADKQGKSNCPRGKILSTDDVVDTTTGSATDCGRRIDGCMHGTHVGALIAGNETPRASGVANKTRLIVVKVMGDDGAFMSSILRGLTWVESMVEERRATGRGPNIVAVNLSLGSEQDYEGSCDDLPANGLISRRIRSLREVGVAVIVAAGNGGATKLTFPACSKHALAVGSIGKDGNLTGFTNRSVIGSAPIFTLGEDVLSAAPGGTYLTLSGTSASAAIATGSYALLKGAYPDATPDEIEEAIRKASRRVKDSRTGKEFSVLDVDGAYDLLPAVLSARDKRH